APARKTVNSRRFKTIAPNCSIGSVVSSNLHTYHNVRSGDAAAISCAIVHRRDSPARPNSFPVVSMGDFAISWTARVAVLLYLARYATQAFIANVRGRDRLARWLWTAGLAVFLSHVLCAYHFLHRW